MDVLIYVLALVPGLLLCFVRDVGPFGGVPLMGIGLLVAPYSATAVVLFAACALVWMLVVAGCNAITGERLP